MNKTILYVVGGVVVVGGAAVFVMNKPAGPVAPGGDANTPTPSAQMSMRELLGMSGPQRCTFTNNVQDPESSGVVYVAGGKMRGDFTSVAAGQTIQSHMIVDGETSYMWSDAMPQGMKMAFADVGAQSGQGSGQSVDVNEKVDYSCSGWTADANMFALPAGVEFSDLGVLLPPGGMPQLDGKPGTIDPSGGIMPAGEVGAMQCAACNQVPEGDERMQCLEALGCAK
jgi:hypothetical protein